MANMNNTVDYKENTAEITQIELLMSKTPKHVIIVLNTKNDSRLAVWRNRDTSHDHSPCLKISFKLDLMANFTQDLKRFEALQHG